MANVRDDEPSRSTRGTAAERAIVLPRLDIGSIQGDGISSSPWPLMTTTEPIADGTIPVSVFDRVKEKAFADRASTAPLWVQVKNALAEAIDRSVPVDSRIPSEQALCGLFGVSRPVVREALDALVGEGRLVKIARRGVFTARPKDDADFLTNAIGVFEDMTAKGHVVTTRTFDLRRAPASDHERKLMSLPSGAEVVRVVRVYLVDGQPLTYTHIAIPAHRAPDLECLLREGQSIFGLLESRFGLAATRAERWFSAVAATDEQAEKLGVAPGQPLIGIESLATCGNGLVLEYYNAVYNPGVARMHVVTAKGATTT